MIGSLIARPGGTARRTIILIVVALGVRALIGLLGYALIVGSAFLDKRSEERSVRTV